MVNLNKMRKQTERATKTYKFSLKNRNTPPPTPKNYFFLLKSKAGVPYVVGKYPRAGGGMYQVIFGKNMKKGKRKRGKY